MNRTEFIGLNLYYSQEFVDDMKKNYEQEIDRLNNIIKHIYKELREFNVYGSIAVSMQISYLEEYLEEKIENIDFEYLQDLKEGKIMDEKTK